MKNAWWKGSWWKASSMCLFVGQVLVGSVVVSGCTAIPPPSVLDDVDRVRQSPSLKGAKRDAPTAFAAAEKLRQDALAAFDAGDHAGAQILGEQALAAYEEAVALGRVVRADKVRETAASDADKEAAHLAQLDQEHQKVAADIAALEERLKVLRALEPISPTGPAGPAREQARWQAVGSLHLSARLLCAAADLLTKSSAAAAPAALTEAQGQLHELTATVAAKPEAAPIDAAMRARAGCLRALTQVRRAAADPKKATGAGDALLEALSQAGQGTPQRDDRGVVVTLRGMFDANGLSVSGKKALETIASVAKAHSRFPVMVVMHDRSALDAAGTSRSIREGEEIVAQLRAQLGEGRVAAPHVAGNAAPIADPNGSGAERNQRVEIVFVSPETL